MEIGEIVSVSAILVGIFVSTLVFVLQIHSYGNRLSDEIGAQGEEIKGQGGRLSDVEREQARLEGANDMLSDVFRQQSHTHETGD